MRILVVQESDWLEKGPHQSHHLMERLTLRGHEVKVIDFEIQWRSHGRNQFFSKRKVFEGVHKATRDGNVTLIRPPIVKAPILEYLSEIHYHRQEIRRQSIDYRPEVIVGFGILDARAAIRLAKKECIPFVYYVIDELHRLLPQKGFRPLAKLIEQSNMRHSTRVISINESLRDYTIQMGANPDRTTIIRAGVDLEMFEERSEVFGQQIRTKLGFAENDTVLFFMGWLYPFSGLMEVSLELSKPVWRNRGVKLLIVGTGDLRQPISDLIGRDNLGDTIFLEDWKPYSEIGRYVLASDICILPAHDVGIMRNIVPIKMYEYMAAGKPVVSTKLPGILKEFDTDHGVSYASGPEDVVDVAYQLVSENRVDEEGRKARDFVKGNSWNQVVSDFEDVLTTAIHDNSGTE